MKCIDNYLAGYRLSREFHDRIRREVVTGSTPELYPAVTYLLAMKESTPHDERSRAYQLGGVVYRFLHRQTI